MKTITYEAAKEQAETVSVFLMLVLTPSSASVKPCVMTQKNGHAMMTAMAGLKPIRTPMKACGRDCVISCVPFAASVNIFCMGMWLFMSLGSISKPFRLLSSLRLFVVTRSEHEPQRFANYSPFA